ncbi:ribonuclease H-like domain-containing protein [Tanacetum coccineum]
MSAHDNFSLHDDEELSLNDDASLAGSVPASNKGDAPAKPPQIITTNTLSNIKLPVLQKDDYDTWAMEMEHYLEYIDNEVWKVIQNGNSKKRVTKGKDGVYRVLPPTTQEEQFADEKERKARTLLLMAVPKDHLRRFHGMDDAKEIWAAIKTRFGGNANSKKMQKAVLKQQFEAFTISSKESLEKGYDRFQKLLSRVGSPWCCVSVNDANHKFFEQKPLQLLAKATAQDVIVLYTTSSSKAKQYCTPYLDQIDDLDLEELDINGRLLLNALKIKECKFKSTKDGSKQEAGRGQDFKPVRTEKEALMTIDEDSFNALQAKYDELLSEFGDQEAVLVAHKLAPQISCPTVSNASSIVFSICPSNDSDGELGAVLMQVNKANQFTPRPVQTSNIRPNFSTASRTIKTGRVNVNTGKQNVSSGSLNVSSGTHIKSGASSLNTGKQHVIPGTFGMVILALKISQVGSRVNTGKQNVNSGRVHVNTARVNRPVLSNQTSQVNIKSPKKCLSKQSSPVNRPFSQNTAYKSNLYAVKGKMGTAVKTLAGCVWRIITPHSNTNSGPTHDSYVHDHPLKHMENRGIFDSGCSGAHGMICDKKLNVLFTENECFVVSSDFKMPDENQVLLKVPRQHNMYIFDMKNVDSSKGYTCLLAKASSNEATNVGTELGHLISKTLNKLVKDNLVRGLPSKSFKNDHTCVACQKGKQHKASCQLKQSADPTPSQPVPTPSSSQVNTPGSDENRLKLYDLMYKIDKPNVVTELPKPLFKKPKLRDNYSAAGLDCEDGAMLRRPVLQDFIFRLVPRSS